MHTRGNQIFRLLMSIVNGVGAFVIMVIFLFFGGILLLMLLASDFLLSSILVILFVLSSIVSLIFAVFVGVKYYRNQGNGIETS